VHNSEKEEGFLRPSGDLFCFPRNEEFMQELLVLFRGEWVVVVLRPDDEGFRINDEATFHSARLTPADKFYRTVAAKLERAHIANCFTFKTDDVLLIPVHGDLLSEFDSVVIEGIDARNHDEVRLFCGVLVDDLELALYRKLVFGS
jgi:hypothetical protein